MTKGIALAACAAIVAGCAPDAAATTPFTVRDSAGVRIVEYADTPTARRTVTFAAEPTWRFGDDAGEYEFEYVVVGALQPDGGAVVVDRSAGEVITIGPDGSFRSVLARRGQGPLEVQGVQKILVLGQDTVVVEDDRNAKVLYFAGGEVIRTVTTRSSRALSYGLRAVGNDGPALLMTTSSYDPRFEGEWLEGHLVRLDPDVGVPDTVGTYDMASAMGTPPYDPLRPFGLVNGSGSSFVVVRSDVPEVVWRAADGRVTQILRWKPVVAYPDESYRQTFEDFLRAELPALNPGMAAAQMEQFIASQMADMRIDPSSPLPLFALPFGDGRGGVWLAEFDIAGERRGFRRYTVVAPDGEWLGTVTAPDRFRILDIRGDRVLGVLRDELDVESVAVFPIIPSP